MSRRAEDDETSSDETLSDQVVGEEVVGDEMPSAGAPTFELAVRRVLVALDASPSSSAAARAAVELAAQWQAEVEGLFVEDRALLDVAVLPLAEWGPEDVERRYRVQASGARRILREAAARHGLRCGFEVVRGHVTEEILRRLPEVDVLVLGRVGWSAGRSGRLGRTAATALARSRGVLLPFGRTGRGVLRLLLR